MNCPELIDPSFSYRLITTFIHFLWQGSLVALLAVLGETLLSRASASRRYTLHVAALTIMIACVAVTFSKVASPISDPSVTTQVAKISPNKELVVPDQDDVDSSDRPSISTPATAAISTVEMVEPQFVGQVRPLSEGDYQQQLHHYASHISLLYFVCCGFLLARLVHGTWLANRVQWLATTVSDDSLIVMLQRQSKELGLRVVPRVAWCAEVSIPLVIGIFKPVILLPVAAATGLSLDQLQALATHELAHIRRYDLLVNLVQRIVESMLFFHPAVWYISRRITSEREQACDELVLATGCERLRYADALVRMAELSSSLRSRRTPAPATSLAASGANSSEFKRRVMKLMSVPITSDLQPSRIALLVIMALIVGAAMSASQLQFNVLAEPPRASSLTEIMPPDGLEFLKSHSKLHELSLDMTEQQFLEIVKQQEVIATKESEEGKTAYHIGLSDGHMLIVMFDEDSKCGGMQRLPGNDKLVGHFNGRVVGPDGRSLMNAHVFLVPFDVRQHAIGAVRAETDADGHFEFDAPDMTYVDSNGHAARRQGLLMATADDYAADWMRTWGHNLGGLRTHFDPVQGAALELRLAKDDVPIQGRFLNHDGQPLAGASIKVEAIMIPRDHNLDEHLKRFSQPFAEFSSPDFERELYRERVQLLPGVVSETRTDAYGRFKLSGFGRDRLVRLNVSAPSVVDTAVTVMTRDVPDAVVKHDGAGVPAPNGATLHGAKFTRQLQPGRTIKGRVIDRETRQPVAGMWVGPRQNAIVNVTRDLYPWITDDAGRFTIFGLSPSVSQEEIAAIATPGLPYPSVSVMADGKKDIVIETSRGIPFRLKLVDEQNRPVDAEVTYSDIHPNPHVAKQRDEFHWPVNRAAKKSDGIYEGFVLPGPGAVLVRLPRESQFRPAQVDPKAFFAPGKNNWTAEELATSYGTTDELVISQGVYRDTLYRSDRLAQKEYAAIVLVNPPKVSGRLELSAVVALNPTDAAASTHSEPQPRNSRPQKPLVAEFSDGSEIELLGVGTQSSGESIYWQPDGTPSDQQPSLRPNRNGMRLVSGRHREFWFETRPRIKQALTNETTTSLRIVYDAAESYGEYSGTSQLLQTAGPFPAAATDILVAMCDVEERNDWGQITASGERGALDDIPAERRLLYARVVPIAVREVDSQCELVLDDRPFGKLSFEFDWHLYADMEGGFLAPLYSVVRDGKRHVRFNAPLRDLVRFRYRIRPYVELIAIRNVSVEPGKNTNVDVAKIVP